MVASFIENVQSLISQCRDLENQHHEKMLEIAIITLEKVVKNELDDEIPDDLREVVSFDYIYEIQRTNSYPCFVRCTNLKIYAVNLLAK